MYVYAYQGIIVSTGTETWQIFCNVCNGKKIRVVLPLLKMSWFSRIGRAEVTCDVLFYVLVFTDRE